MTPTPTQHRLMARFVAAIYGIVDALIPFVAAIMTRPDRPWVQRARLEARFYAVLRELLALSGRTRPEILSPHPVFPAAPPRQHPTAARTPAIRIPRAPAPPGRIPLPDPPVSARQLAKRIAALLRELEAIAREAAAILPIRVRQYATQARAIAGCHALPPPHPTWERAG